MKKIIEIYTDGSCLQNPGAGGWAAIIRCSPEAILTGGEPDTTNNRMEMTAILYALKWLADNNFETAIIHTDSNLAVQILNKRWKRKKNLDLWQKIDVELMKLINTGIEWRWVKGHAGHELNERVDDLARKEATKMQNIAAASIDATNYGCDATQKKNQKDEITQKTETMRMDFGDGPCTGEYVCKKCRLAVNPRLEYLEKSGLLKALCPWCGAYIKFAKKTKENFKKIK